GADPGEEDVSLEEYDPKAGLRVTVVGSVAEQQGERIIDYLQAAGGTFDGSKTDLVKAVGMNRSEFYRSFGELERCGRLRTLGRSTKENRPKGQVVLIADENGESSRRPESSPVDRDCSDRPPRNSPRSQ